MGIIKQYLFVLSNYYQYFAILGLLFLTVASLCLAAFLLMRRKDRTMDRLRELDKTFLPEASAKLPSIMEREKPGRFDKLANSLEGFLASSNREEMEKQRLKFIQAGWRARSARRNFVLAKCFLALLLPALFLVYSSTYTITLKAAVISLSMAAVGYFIPEIFLLHFREKRQGAIRRGLPDALDLMVICVTAGLGLDMTFKRVGQELKDLWQELSDEFHLTILEIRAGKARAESYNNLALRSGVPEMQSLMSMLNQTNRFGTSVADALRVYAQSMRVKRRQLAEELAAKTAVKIMLPLVLFIFPALMIILIGPGGIRIFRNLFPALGG
jgi:tight adherence protein C